MYDNLMKSFTALQEARENLEKCRAAWNTAHDEYSRHLYDPFSLFSDVDTPEGWVPLCGAITVPYNGSSELTKVKFNAKDGNVRNLYFADEKELCVLKYGELLSFFEKEVQIEDLCAKLKTLRDSF